MGSGVPPRRPQFVSNRGHFPTQEVQSNRPALLISQPSGLVDVLSVPPAMLGHDPLIVARHEDRRRAILIRLYVGGPAIPAPNERIADSGGQCHIVWHPPVGGPRGNR